ncbi:MAG TPA: hypothetical protein VNS81_00540 [Nocardioides sp.]|nr:hypothetical protein [Nocardioides sp.]
MDLEHLLGEAFLPASFPLPLDRPFTYRDALREAGLSSRELHWLVTNGFLWRPVKGVYVATPVPDSIDLRCAALRLVVPPDAVICDRHAGWLHGATMVLAPNEHIELAPITVFLPADRGRLRNLLADSGERTFRSGDVTELGGLRVTTPLRTAWDLGRSRWAERSLAAMDQMLGLGSFTKQELSAGIEQFRGMRWVTTLRAMAPLTDGHAESPPESVLRLRWLQCHLPTPTPQVEVRAGGRFLARLDVGNEALRFGAEYDSDEWHTTPEQLAHDRGRRAAVEQATDWLVLPIRRENLFGPTQNAEALLRAAAAAARRREGRAA